MLVAGFKPVGGVTRSGSIPPSRRPTHLGSSRPAEASLAQSVERKALNLVVVGSSPTVGVFLRYRSNFDRLRGYEKMDLSGFEPEAFCMQSRRDTTTPQALYA